MTKLTLLNSMAGADFAQALDRHLSWGLTVLDLKDAIFGKGIAQLTSDEAQCADALIAERGLAVHCFSTTLFDGNIELGEDHFRTEYLGNIDHLIELAHILKPRMIRLLAAQTSARREVVDSISYINDNYPWLIPLHGEAIDRIYDAGFQVTIENEVGKCIFSTPEEIVNFFFQLDRSGKVSFTWDVQNLWQMGTFPSLEVYRKLRSLIGYYHLKGGMCEPGNSDLCWRSSLEDASWPVVEITRQVVADEVSPVICLNPSHGKAKEGYDYSQVTKRDLDFIRREIPVMG